MTPNVSICIATYNKPTLLKNTLDSIFYQVGNYEVIAVDDGSPTSDTKQVCSEYPITYIRIERNAEYRNPAIARNVAYKAAKGEIVIAQSDDVIHHSPNCIATLAGQLKEGTFVIATVLNVANAGKSVVPVADAWHNKKDKISYYTGPLRPRPLFFLGALYRKDIYAIGGNDEEFICPGREDVWFGMCLTRGLKLVPIYADNVIGHHQVHTRLLPSVQINKSRRLFTSKHRLALKGLHPWTAKSGPWEM